MQFIGNETRYASGPNSGPSEYRYDTAHEQHSRESKFLHALGASEIVVVFRGAAGWSPALFFLFVGQLLVVVVLWCGAKNCLFRYIKAALLLALAIVVS
jgi:hypothetical protein